MLSSVVVKENGNCLDELYDGEIGAIPNPLPPYPDIIEAPALPNADVAAKFSILQNYQS